MQKALIETAGAGGLIAMTVTIGTPELALAVSVGTLVVGGIVWIVRLSMRVENMGDDLKHIKRHLGIEE